MLGNRLQVRAEDQVACKAKMVRWMLALRRGWLDAQHDQVARLDLGAGARAHVDAVDARAELSRVRVELAVVREALLVVEPGHAPLRTRALGLRGIPDIDPGVSCDKRLALVHKVRVGHEHARHARQLGRLALNLRQLGN